VPPTVERVPKQFALLVARLVVVLLLAGQLARAAAGPSPGDPQDSRPVWAGDGVHVAFNRQFPGQTSVLQMTSAGKDTFVELRGAETVRGYAREIGRLLVQMGGETQLITGDRFAPPLAVLHGVDATSSPDGTRAAYLRNGTLYVASIVNLPTQGASVYSPPEQALATGIDPPSWDILGPVWSPDGKRIVVASGSSLVLVNADGSGSRILVTGENQSVNPTWSPDGSTIAFERNFAPHWQIWVANASGDPNAHAVEASSSANFRYPQFSPHSTAMTYISDLQHARGGATPYQFALYLRDFGGIAHKLLDDVHPYSPATWSPTGALLAVSAGQECRRWGIYILRSNVGAHATRRSDVCRFNGTAGADTIHGSPYFDIVNGRGGNDRLYGFDGNDAIYGENGDDVLLGQNGNDTIFGGPGDDRIYGGPGNDVIIPGNGRDVVDCGPGVDTVEGVGPLDRIAKNCEHVRH
jgi:Ca2+-binding RTX toxin-like protein